MRPVALLAIGCGCNRDRKRCWIAALGQGSAFAAEWTSKPPAWIDRQSAKRRPRLGNQAIDRNHAATTRSTRAIRSRGRKGIAELFIAINTSACSRSVDQLSTPPDRSSRLTISGKRRADCLLRRTPSVRTRIVDHLKCVSVPANVGKDQLVNTAHFFD